MGVLPDDVQAAATADTYPGVAKDLKIESLKGVPVVDIVRITDDFRKEADISKGLNGVVIGLVTDPETPAGVAGLRPGDVVVEMNDKSKKDVSFKVNRKGTEVTIGIRGISPFARARSAAPCSYGSRSAQLGIDGWTPFPIFFPYPDALGQYGYAPPAGRCPDRSQALF